MSYSDSPQDGDVKILVVRTVWRNIHPAIIINNIEPGQSTQHTWERSIEHKKL